MIDKTNILIHYTLCGVKIQERYTGPILSASKCKVKLFENEFDNCITIDYQFSVPKTRTKKPDKFHLYLYKESKYFLYIFNLLLTRPSELIFIKYIVDGNEIKLDLPAREAPLRLYNLANIVSHDVDPIMAKYTSYINHDGWPLFEKLIRRFKRKNNSFRQNIYIALRWFQKGCDETTSIDKLMAFWIAFNSLYQDINENNEKRAIKRYITTTVNDSLASEYCLKNEPTVKLLTDFSIELGRGANRLNITQELSNSLRASNRQYVTIVKQIVLSIYGIRNNLFHGDVNLDDEDTLSLIEIGDILIGEFLKELLCYLILDAPLPKIKFKDKEQLTG